MNMTNQQIAFLINTLRLTSDLTLLQKDILDTWNELQKDPFDKESARRQIVSNNINYPDVFAAIQVLPGVVQKPFDAVTPEEMIHNLHRQLEGLVYKEMGDPVNGKEKQ